MVQKTRIIVIDSQGPSLHSIGAITKTNWLDYAIQRVLLYKINMKNLARNFFEQTAHRIKRVIVWLCAAMDLVGPIDFVQSRGMHSLVHWLTSY